MILLKKAMDDVLKKVNLPSLYVERVKNSGGVTQLCTPCGKPLVFIPDVRITHSKLTKDEREYIIKEISTFIMDNVDTIKKALKIRLNPTELKEYEGYNVSVNNNYNYGYQNRKQDKKIKSVVIGIIDEEANHNEKFKLTLTTDNEFFISVDNHSEKELPKTLERLPEMKKIAKDSMKLAEKMLQEDIMMTELTTCHN